MSKWFWYCTTTGLYNFIELRMEKICPVVSEIHTFCKVWTPLVPDFTHFLPMDNSIMAQIGKWTLRGTTIDLDNSTELRMEIISPVVPEIVQSAVFRARSRSLDHHLQSRRAQFRKWTNFETHGYIYIYIPNSFSWLTLGQTAPSALGSIWFSQGTWLEVNSGSGIWFDAVITWTNMKKILYAIWRY